MTPDTRAEPGAEPDALVWPRRRSFALPGVLSAMVAVGLVAGAYMLWHTPLPPDPDGGLRCSRAFDARLHAARGGTDAELVALGDDALAARCGKQAFAAADTLGWDGDEAAAWRLARFYDPGETDPLYRGTVPPDAAQAATAYARWAPRSARMADALKRLCTTDGPALDRDPALRRSCGR